jgi:hypothetical protein
VFFLRRCVSSSPSSSVTDLADELLLRGYGFNSISDVRFLGRIEIGGVFATGGRYSSNRYFGIRSRDVVLSRGVPPSRPITDTMSSKIMLLLMLTLIAYRLSSVGGGGGRGMSLGGSGKIFSFDPELWWLVPLVDARPSSAIISFSRRL